MNDPMYAVARSPTEKVRTANPRTHGITRPQPRPVEELGMDGSVILVTHACLMGASSQPCRLLVDAEPRSAFEIREEDRSVFLVADAGALGLRQVKVATRGMVVFPQRLRSCD